jgi:mannose-1-phosphate guanylyltransferase/mannose-6-phosphate isomerase
MLAGGIGARLWPLSTPELPKQFLALQGHETLLQQTALRLARTGLCAAPLVVTGESYRFLAAAQLQQVGYLPQAILLEPEARNTAPAFALALAWAERYAPHALLLLTPCDHAIGDEQGFREALIHAGEDARSGHPVVIGVPPTHPDPGFGYIAPGEAHAPSRFRVQRFMEKPETELAARWIASGALWHSGIVCVAVETALQLYRAHASQLWQSCREAFALAGSTQDFIRPDPAAFARAPSLPFDRAILEPAAESCMLVRGTMGWNDLGAWHRLPPRTEAVARPWGHYTSLGASTRYRVKELTLLPGTSLSLQRHRLRSEHWLVITGEAEVIKNGRMQRLFPGESVDIPSGALHQLRNPSRDESLTVIEIQTGSYFGEDDIERVAEGVAA